MQYNPHRIGSAPKAPGASVAGVQAGLNNQTRNLEGLGNSLIAGTEENNTNALIGAMQGADLSDVNTQNRLGAMATNASQPGRDMLKGNIGNLYKKKEDTRAGQVHDEDLAGKVQDRLFNKSTEDVRKNQLEATVEGTESVTKTRNAKEVRDQSKFESNIASVANKKDAFQKRAKLYDYANTFKKGYNVDSLKTTIADMERKNKDGRLDSKLENYRNLLTQVDGQEGDVKDILKRQGDSNVAMQTGDATISNKREESDKKQDSVFNTQTEKGMAAGIKSANDQVLEYFNNNWNFGDDAEFGKGTKNQIANIVSLVAKTTEGGEAIRTGNGELIYNEVVKKLEEVGLDLYDNTFSDVVNIGPSGRETTLFGEFGGYKDEEEVAKRLKLIK